jgi:hypothetical protein
MRRPWWLVMILGGALAAAGASATDDDEGRRLLDRLRADPEHYQRLRRDLLAFHALPRARQEQVRQLDQDLHAGDVTRRTRLLGVLDRYAGWLDKLPDTDRRLVADAAGPEDRLRVIRELRDRQWLDRLPKRTRDEVQQLPPEKRGQKIASLREEDRKRRRAWQGKDDPRLRPVRMEQFAPEVRAFVEALGPRLGEADRQRLRQAEGRWPDYAKAVLDIADNYPVLPPLPSGPVARWKELPREVDQLLAGLEKRKVKQLKNNAPVGWPMFAEVVARFLRQEKLAAPPLGASRLGEMPPEVQAAAKERLLPLLAPRQREALLKAEGHWPDYPQTLIRLARERGVVLPGLSLPGPPELWESVRLAMHEVPDRVLMQFARYEASEADRQRWKLNKADPVGSREKVKKEWYRKQMAEQERRRKAAGPAPVEVE